MAEEKEKNGQEIKLAKIELGKQYEATIIADYTDAKDDKKKMTLKFKVHIPSMQEDLKIAVREEQTLGKDTSDQFTVLAARMLATLEIVIDEIYYTDENNQVNRFFGTFTQLTEKIRVSGKFYKEVVFPVYNEFIKFQNSIDMGFDELKNLLAQTGKK